MIEPTPATRQRHKAALTGLALITCLAACLRLWQVHDSLWVDELHTAWTIQDGFSQIGPRARMGNQSPLFFYACRLSTDLFGFHELGLRLPTLLTGILLVPLLYLVVLYWTGSPGAGLLAATLAALDRNFVFYAQEARPYGWVQLLGLLHVLIFWRQLVAPRPWTRIAFVLGAVLLFYLHYTAALLLLAELVYLLVWAWRRRGKQEGHFALRWIVDLSLIAVASLPAFPQLADIAQRRDNWSRFVKPQPAVAMLTLFPLQAYVLAPAVIATVDAWRQKDLPQRADESKLDPWVLGLAGCWLAVPILATWFSTWRGWAHLFLLRYVIASSTAPLILAGCAYACCRFVRYRALLVAVVVVLTISISGFLRQWRLDGRLLPDRNEDWRGAVQWINQQDQQGRLPALIRSGFVEADQLRQAHDPLLWHYCLLPVTSMYPILPADRELIPLPTRDTGQLRRDQQDRILAAGGAWLVLRATPAATTRILRQLRQTLGRWGISPAARSSFGGVTVIQFTHQGSDLAPR